MNDGGGLGSGEAERKTHKNPQKSQAEEEIVGVWVVESWSEFLRAWHDVIARML